MTRERSPNASRRPLRRRTGLAPSHWVSPLVSGCQQLADRLARSAAPSICAHVRALVERVPPRISAQEEMLARSLFGQLLGRIISCGGLERRPECAHAFVAFTTCPFGSAAWRGELARLVDRC